MHISTFLRAAPVAAVLLLGACNKPATETAGTEAGNTATAAPAAPVELPPAMTASKSYRCKDGSVAFVDFFAGEKQAILHSGKRDAEAVTLTGEAGKPLTAEGGYSLTGSGATITLAQPGKPSQSCKA